MGWRDVGCGVAVVNEVVRRGLLVGRILTGLMAGFLVVAAYSGIATEAQDRIKKLERQIAELQRAQTAP